MDAETPTAQQQKQRKQQEKEGERAQSARSPEIRREHLMAVVRATMGGGGISGQPDPDNPLPPGPWDPVIRAALERVRVVGRGTVFGPHPEPWRFALARLLRRHPEVWDVLGGGGGFGDEVALNPQPLPPRFAFLMAAAREVATRAEMLAEFAGAMEPGRQGEERGIIIVSGYMSRYVDDICGNDFRFRWPLPGPRPNWLAAEVSGIDLVVMAAQFDQSARESFSPVLRRALGDATEKLAETGLARLR